MCQKGECRDRLWLDNVGMRIAGTDTMAFIAPRHVRTFECICAQGYGGKYFPYSSDCVR